MSCTGERSEGGRGGGDCWMDGQAAGGGRAGGQGQGRVGGGDKLKEKLNTMSVFISIFCSIL